RSDPPVAVLEPDHVVQVGRGRFEDVHVRDGLHTVDRAGRDPVALSLAQRDLFELLRRGPRPEPHLAPEQVDRLVLADVVLQREGVTGLHVQDLPHVTGRVCPDEFVAPRLLHTRQPHGSTSAAGEPRRALRARRGGATTLLAPEPPAGKPAPYEKRNRPRGCGAGRPPRSAASPSSARARRHSFPGRCWRSGSGTGPARMIVGAGTFSGLAFGSSVTRIVLKS